jgi:dienelactone hydrolase
MGWRRLSLGHAADAARLHRDERRQPRHRHAARPNVAEDRVWRGRGDGGRGSDGGGEDHRKDGLCRFDANGRVGWSGGGSTTLGLLFTSPDVYRMGMAVAPVSDKRYYDTIYQERYMGLPATNVEGYRRASALPFAKNLKADLLIVHGSGDDNVHYQNTEAVVNALVAANKPFTMMVYPNRTHCICEGENTTVHLFTMLTRYVDEHLGSNPSER